MAQYWLHPLFLHLLAHKKIPNFPFKNLNPFLWFLLPNNLYPSYRPLNLVPANVLAFLPLNFVIMIVTCENFYIFASCPSSFSDNSSYPNSHFIFDEKFSLCNKEFLAATSTDVEPSRFSKALSIPHWRDPMRSEINALKRNQTWHVTTLLPGEKASSYKWVYRIKWKLNGSIEDIRLNCLTWEHSGRRLPWNLCQVAKMVIVCILLSVAAARKWEIHQIDVQNAFLHGNLEEEVYMKLSLGFSKRKDGKVYDLTSPYTDWNRPLDAGFLNSQVPLNSAAFVKLTQIILYLLTLFWCYFSPCFGLCRWSHHHWKLFFFSSKVQNSHEHIL